MSPSPPESWASWGVARKGGKRAARRTVQIGTDKRRERLTRSHPPPHIEVTALPRAASVRGVAADGQEGQDG